MRRIKKVFNWACIAAHFFHLLPRSESLWERDGEMREMENNVITAAAAHFISVPVSARSANKLFVFIPVYISHEHHPPCINKSEASQNSEIILGSAPSTGGCVRASKRALECEALVFADSVALTGRENPNTPPSGKVSHFLTKKGRQTPHFLVWTQRWAH